MPLKNPLTEISYALTAREVSLLENAGVFDCVGFLAKTTDPQARSALAAVTGLSTERLALLAAIARCHSLHVPGATWASERCRIGVPLMNTIDNPRAWEEMLARPDSQMPTYLLDPAGPITALQSPAAGRIGRQRVLLATTILLLSIAAVLSSLFRVPGATPAWLAARWHADAVFALAAVAGLAVLWGSSLLFYHLSDVLLSRAFAWFVDCQVRTVGRAAALDAETIAARQMPGWAHFAERRWLALIAVGLCLCALPLIGWERAAIIACLAGGGIVGAQQAVWVRAFDSLEVAGHAWARRAQESLARFASLRLVLRATLLLAFLLLVPTILELSQHWVEQGPPTLAVHARDVADVGSQAGERAEPASPGAPDAAQRTAGQALIAELTALLRWAAARWDQLQWRGAFERTLGPTSLVKTGTALAVCIVFAAARWYRGFVWLFVWITANLGLQVVPETADWLLRGRSSSESLSLSPVILLVGLGATIFSDQLVALWEQIGRSVCSSCGWRSEQGRDTCEVCGTPLMITGRGK